MVSDASAEAGLSLRTIPRSASAGIALAMVAGFVIRACTGDCPMLRDELSSIVFASQPLSRMWSVWMVRQTNPPLFHSLLRGWLALRARLVTQIRLLRNIGGVVAIGLVRTQCARVFSCVTLAV